MLLAAAAGLFGFAVHRYLFAGGLFTGGAGRIPKRFIVKDIPTQEIPTDARRPLDFLSDRLKRLGFEAADLPVRVPALQSFGHRVVLVPFVHRGESAIFLMGIESRWAPRAELMLHILTPMKNAKRVETSTLAALRHIKPPESVDVRVVLDAGSVDEIWSQHRRALTKYERADRLPVEPDAWKAPVAQAYDAWVEAAVRAQRLRLDPDGATYHLRRDH
jgi:hypothetical protein